MPNVIQNPDVEIAYRLFLPSSEIKTKEKLSLHTSFKIGGSCKCFISPSTEQEIKLSIEYAKQNKSPILIIGNGSKLLFPDDGFAGIVIHIGEPYFANISVKNNLIRVGAGISIQGLLRIATKKGLAGIEFMAGIPGTLGGAIAMNAGAYGKRIAEIVDRIKIMNPDGTIYWIEKQDAGFGYRESRFKNSGEIVLEAELNLKKATSCEIDSQIQEILFDRASKLPLEFPSAGCIFKNPANVSAGKLIELAECKGLRIGEAQVSDKHGNFIVNLGAATYKDVRAIIKEVQHKVDVKLSSVDLASPLTKSYFFNVSGNKIIVNLDKLKYNAGEIGMVVMANSGGLGTQYNYTLKIKGRDDTVYYKKSGLTDIIQTWGNNNVDFNIPKNLASGLYRFSIDYNELGDAKKTSWERYIMVNGLNATMDVATSKNAYD
ncbi:MAG: UDP-N-acetylmuramate dehydrogenase, partial [Candidatus Stahlbacteria bacterium]|nr:UDP-N-acetylmuramate dehydrogenase [Candidatus Stahlbacteria bacterium]